MTTTGDAGAEAVKRLRKLIAMHGDDADAATLRALLARAEKAEAERNDLAAKVVGYRHNDQHAASINSKMQAELDAVRAERDRLREALRQVLTVMPVLPRAAKQIVGMEDRYEAAITAARVALKETGHD